MGRNFVLNLLDGAVFGFGMSLVARTTVLPLIIARAGGGNIAIGLIPVIWIVGRNMPQLATASLLGRARSLHRFVLGTTLIQRLPWAAMAVLVFFAESIPGRILPALILIGIATGAMATGFNLPAWFDLVADLTPTRLRGRLFGLRAVFTGLLGMLGGWIVVLVLDRWGWPDGFAALFALAFGAMVVSYVFLVLLRDDRPPRERSELPIRSTLKRLPSLLREWPNYRHFLVADILLVVSTFSSGFLAVAAFDRLAIEDADVGRFTIVATGSAMAAAFVFGLITDRYGHRAAMIAAAGASAGSCLAALVAPAIMLFYLAFALAAVAEGLRTMSQLPLIAELCGETDRASFVALANVAIIPVALLGASAGLLANVLGFGAVFVATGLAALGSLYVLVRHVTEPRRQPGITENPS